MICKLSISQKKSLNLWEKEQIALKPYNTIDNFVSFSKDLVIKEKIFGLIYQVSVLIAKSFKLVKTTEFKV